MKKYYLLLCGLCFLFTCKSDKTAPDPQPSSVETPVEQLTKSEPARFKVNIENLRVRDEPGTSGKEVVRLPSGHEVVALGEISNFTSPVRLRGVSYKEPWVKVKTNSGQEGWVYAGGVQLNRQSELGKQLINSRLDNFGGTGTAVLANQYLKDFQDISDAATFASVYRKAAILVDTLNEAISDRVMLDNLTADEPLPDLSWLETMLPGFTLEQVAEGTTFYFFRDFRVWYPLAEKTASEEDNEFLDLMVHVHPMDSVAYFFPSWFLQTWDYGGNSLLGKGIHLSVLKKMDQLNNKSNLFKEEVLIIKENLLQDIIGHNDHSYEMPQSDILKELDQILSANLNVLTKQDMLALKQRRKQFVDAKANGIKVNQRAGM